ncbi:DUF2955 domain-containing protein [Thalassotalea sp. HSM 43]|uniref:DUF2955 domain-containing protein n=1 Tax=Thalassotalea sp. HSM 43 TaxID=2552945 RepID=UPI001080AD13|nr:DUF2955 domain-containing protein [Thalassotalea sp. HSM 43]QBY04849.1 DUF2955 domain-containing protein [Thalassotalea sp. HSM 43]
MRVTTAIHHALHSQSDDVIRMLRLTFGLTLAIALAFAIAWPLSFITAVFTGSFLGNRSGKMPFKVLVTLLMVATTAFVSGILISSMLLNYPIVFMLVMTLIIFAVSYWSYRGGNDFVIAMLLVGFTLVPLLGILHPAIAGIVTQNFIISCGLALFITMLSHEIIPDKPDVVTAPPKPVFDVGDKVIGFQLALLSTIIIMPAMIFFFYFGLTSDLLVLVFIAILAQKPDVLIGMKGAMGLLLGNIMGGIISIVIFNALIMVPSYTFMILVFLVLISSLGRVIFSDSRLAPLYAMALNTVVIIVAKGSGEDGNAADDFYIRIFQIGAACAYVVFAAYVTTPWLSQIKAQYHQLQQKASPP